MFKIIVNIGEISKEYNLSGETKFSKIKDLIKEDFNIEYKFLLVNKTPRVYRNFGKMFLEQDTIQKNYELRTLFNFLNENQELTLGIEEDTQPEPLPETALGSLTNKVNNNEFIFNDADFPPL